MEQTTELETLIASARLIAVRSAHTQLDPGHVLLAMVERGYPLGPALLDRLHLDVDALRADLDRRYRCEPPPPPGMLGVGAAMEHVRAVAEGQQNSGPLTSEAMLIAAWNEPGVTSRFTHRGRWLATAALRDALGSPGLVDRARMYAHRQRMGVARRFESTAQTGVGRMIVKAYGAVNTLREWFVVFFGAVVNTGAVLLLGPGLAMLEGGRAILARVLGSRRRAPEFLRSLGSDYHLDPLPSPARSAAILLAPHLITFVAGVALLIQPLLDARTIGSNPLPVLSSRGGDVLNENETALVADFVTRSPIAMWFGLACLFVALPPYATVRQGRAELSACGFGGRSISRSLLPLSLVAACLTPIEWIMSKLGFNAMLGAGLVTLGFGVFISSTIVDGYIL